MDASRFVNRRFAKLTALCLFSSFSVVLTAQTAQSSPKLILPDPTPREVDLDKRLKTTPPPVSDARISDFNHRRFELIGQASDHMLTLSKILQNSIAKQKDKTLSASESQVAGAIEKIAANIHSAIAPTDSHPAKEHSEARPPSSESVAASNALIADANLLAELTGSLRYEIYRSSESTLPVGVLTKSAQITDLAHSLKERLSASEGQNR